MLGILGPWRRVSHEGASQRDLVADVCTEDVKDG